MGSWTGRRPPLQEKRRNTHTGGFVDVINHRGRDGVDPMELTLGTFFFVPLIKTFQGEGGAVAFCLKYLKLQGGQGAQEVE